MTYYVAKVLHMRPLEILENWSYPELIVAYGQYSNEVTEQNYEEWKSLDTESRNKTKKPKQYNVRFYDIENE